MDKKEFEEVVTPRVNNGIGGGVSQETWLVIVDVYMTTSLTKDQLADLFWNHTGRWSKIEAAVKEYREAQKRKSEQFKALQAAIDAARRTSDLINIRQREVDDLVTDFRIDYAIKHKDNN